LRKFSAGRPPGLELDAIELGKAVHIGHRRAEALGDLLLGGLGVSITS